MIQQPFDFLDITQLKNSLDYIGFVSVNIDCRNIGIPKNDFEFTEIFKSISHYHYYKRFVVKCQCPVLGISC